jgi:quinoprotein dehydrogenase-associated probable ABC transporter substrate-binding protein
MKQARPAKRKSGNNLYGALAATAAALLALPALAADAPERKAFRVCQDPNNLPFSSVKGDGYENKIAELFAKDLGLPVEYFSFPNRLAFIRNTLRYKLPGEEYRCDIVMGVPAGFDQVSATKPYYRSTYALVIPKGKGMDAVGSTQDFLKLDKPMLDKLRIGIYDRSPASEWLNKHALLEQAVPYKIMNPDPDQYPGEIIEKDLAAGKIDVAIVWGPIAGYFARRVQEPKLTVIPMQSEPGVKFDYQMAMGVRYGEREWKQQIEGLIDKHRDAIAAILRDYNIPLLEVEAGRPPSAAAASSQAR